MSSGHGGLYLNFCDQSLINMREEEQTKTVNTTSNQMTCSTHVCSLKILETICLMCAQGQQTLGPGIYVSIYVKHKESKQLCPEMTVS